MWIDLIALAILAIFVVVGMVRGTLAGILRVATLVLSYASAWAASISLGGLVGAQLGVSNLIGGIAAGVGGFFVAFVVLSLISSLILRAERARLDGEPRGAVDRLCGGMIGALQGGLIILVIGLLANWLEAATSLGAPLAPTPTDRVQSTETSPAEAPLSAKHSRVAHVTQQVLEAGADVVLDDSPESQLAASLMIRPTETLGGLQEVFDSPQVAELQNDALFWQYMSSGAVDQALNRNSFRSIAYDSNLRGQMVDMGLIGEAARDDPAAFRALSREMMMELAPRLEAIRNDPELQELGRDPAIQQALASGDTVSLLMNPRIRSFVNRATQGMETSGN